MITISNYEEYFLLYIDGELGQEQCAAVEAFVLQHPHLKAELDMLLDTKLLPEETFEFGSKNILYKTADNGINTNNYEEYFLLHTDKELTESQEDEVEQFVLQHPQLQEAFLSIQKAKLVPEDIACPDKQRLYKQPNKRVIPLIITRMAVAAAVAGVVILTGKFLINNNQQPQVAINVSHPQHTPGKQTILSQPTPAVAVPEKKNTDVIIAKNDKVFPVKKENNSINKIPAVVVRNKDKNEAPVMVKVEPVQLSQPTLPAPEEALADNNSPVKRQQATTLKPLEEVDEKEVASTVAYVSNDYSTAKPAVYKELNTNDDDQTLYVGSLQLNRAKVNGLLKKATHLLGGKAKDANL